MEKWILLWMILCLIILFGYAYRENKKAKQNYQPKFKKGLTYKVDNEHVNFLVTEPDSFSTLAEGTLLVPFPITSFNVYDKMWEVEYDKQAKVTFHIDGITIHGQSVKITGVEAI